MSSKNQKSYGLRKRARNYHRQSKLLLASRKVFEAAIAKQQALDLEQQALDLECLEFYEDDAAGFDDADLDSVVLCTVGGAS